MAEKSWWDWLPGDQQETYSDPYEIFINQDSEWSRTASPADKAAAIKSFWPERFLEWLLTPDGNQFLSLNGQAVGNGTIKLPDGTYLAQNQDGTGFMQVAPGVGQQTENNASGLPPGWQDVGPMPSQPLPAGYHWEPNYSAGKWELAVGSPATADTGAMTDYQRAQVGLTEQQLAQQQYEFQRQQTLSEQKQQLDRQSYLAQMLTQPQSFIQFALETGAPPVVQPWMVPLMGSQYGQPQVGSTIPGWSGQQWKNPNNNLTPSGIAPTTPTGTTTPATTAPTMPSASAPSGGTTMPYTGQSYPATPMPYTPGTAAGPTPMSNNTQTPYIAPVPTPPQGSAPNYYGQTPQTPEQIAPYYSQFTPSQAAANPQGTAAQIYNQQVWDYSPANQLAIAEHLRQAYANAGITGPNMNVNSGGTIPEEQYWQMFSQAIQEQNAWEAAMKNSGQLGTLAYGAMAPGMTNPVGPQTWGDPAATSSPNVLGGTSVWNAGLPTTPTAPTASSSIFPQPMSNPVGQTSTVNQTWMTNPQTPIDTQGTLPTTRLGLPQTTTPGSQYWARMGPTAQSQYLGYQSAATGAPPEETLWRRAQTSAPTGGSGAISYQR